MVKTVRTTSFVEQLVKTKIQKEKELGKTGNTSVFLMDLNILGYSGIQEFQCSKYLHIF